MKTTKTLYVNDRDDWRAWLKKNHDTKNEVWLIFYKKHTGKPNISYDDSVKEALCFGWIDSTIKRIDDEKFARKFTARKAKSSWSKLNKKRAQKMIEEDKMTEKGLALIRRAKESGEWFRTATPRKELVIPFRMKAALAANKKALENFNNLATCYKRQYVGGLLAQKGRKP